MPSYDQGYQTGAKLGTLFWGTMAPGDWQDLLVDLSQEATNLIEGDSGIYATNDARFNAAGARTIHLEVTISTASTGVLYLQGAPGSEQILSASSGAISIDVNGTTVGTMTPSGLTGTARVHQLAWVTEPNPDTTGTSDAMLSWIVCWNENTSTASRAGPWAHEAADSADDLVVWGSADDIATDAYSSVISIVSFHVRALTLAELYDTYVSSSGTISTDVEVRREPLPLTLATGLGDQDQCYGPTQAWAAAVARGVSMRLATARHERFPVLELSNAYADSSDVEWVRAIPQTSYRGHLGHLLALPVPPGCDRLWVRLHAKLWVTSGAAVPIGIRVYSANRPPELALEAGAPEYSATYVGALVSRDDTPAGTGQWWTPQLLEVTRATAADPKRRGWTYVIVAWAIDPSDSSANDANARLQINAIHLVPCREA